MLDRRCKHCGEPLSRKSGEAQRDWATRSSCNRSCHVAWKNSKPLWVTLYERTRAADTGCIEWTGRLDAKGYGRFSAAGGEVLAHRIAYSVHFGAIPEGAHILHRCDNRRCVNPHHLFLGSNDENMADMVRKGRASRRFGMDNPNYRHGRNCKASPRAAQIRTRELQ